MSFLKYILPQIDNNEFFIWDAVVQFRDNIYQSDFRNCTKCNYLTNMLKLIESGVVDVRSPLKKIDELLIKELEKKVNLNPKWSKSTKTVRRSCLNSFFNFVKSDFNKSIKPYRRHPDEIEIKHVLSSVKEKALTKDISPIQLCNALNKINERDAYIVWLMMHTGQKLETLLDLQRNDYKPPYMRFNNKGIHIPEHVVEALNELCKNSKVYLFETIGNRRIRRTQVMRNLKQAGHNIGLDFDLTPKVLHGYVCAYMCQDKRSELEKAIGFSIE